MKKELRVSKLSINCYQKNRGLYCKLLNRLQISSKNIANVCWLNGNAFVSWARGRRFKSRACQFKHIVANGLQPLLYFFVNSCVFRAQWRVDGARKLITSFAQYREYNERYDLKIIDKIRFGLNLNFELEFESAHELLMNLNLNSTFAKSINLNLNLAFSKSMNLN